MQVTVKLFASLGQFLPASAKNNKAEMDVADASTVTATLSQLGVPEDQCHLVLVNGAYVAPSSRATHALNDNDTLAVWPPVAGG
ncbi:MAG: sulfur carrier protein ThiS [Magnetospiraceae bacterium]